MARVSLTCALLCLTTAAHAQDAAPAEDTVEGVSPEDMRYALSRFELANVAYAEGRFPEAVELLRDAVAHYGHPNLIYNLARTLESMGALGEAIEVYERYVALGDRPDERTVRERLRSLRRVHAQAIERLEEIRALRTRLADTPSVPEWLSWSVFGLGLAGAGVGVGLYVQSVAARDAADREPTMLAAAQRMDESQAFYIGALTSWIAGGLLAATGLALGVYELTRSRRGESLREMSVRLGPTGAELEVRF